MGLNTGLLTQGTSFKISEDDGVTFINLGCVTDWSIETSDRPEVDTTCTTDTSKSFKFGLKDDGTLSVTCFYAPEGAGMALVEASYASNDPFDFEVEYSNTAGTSGTIKRFKGYVTSISESGAKDDVINLSLNIKISGAVTKLAPVA